MKITLFKLVYYMQRYKNTGDLKSFEKGSTYMLFNEYIYIL